MQNRHVIKKNSVTDRGYTVLRTDTKETDACSVSCIRYNHIDFHVLCGEVSDLEDPFVNDTVTVVSSFGQDDVCFIKKKGNNDSLESV